jgi:hypothetical protein
MRSSSTAFAAGIGAATLLQAGCALLPAVEAAPSSTPAVAASPGASPAPADLGWAIRDALGMAGEVHYFDATADLNGDGTAEVVVYAAGPMFCGTGGCNMLVFTPADAGYRLVSQISVVQPPVRLSPRSHQGWRNLVVGIRGGGVPSGHAELMFDGRSYPSNPTVPPAERVRDLRDMQILISEFGSYKEGKPVPPSVR